MNTRIPFIALLAFLSFLLTTAAEAKRVALVIGNGSYSIQPLANPVRDAEAVADAFRRLGFDTVNLVTNLDSSGMKSAISRFGADAVGADIAVVYYAGHGLENSGINYLIPVDAKLARAADLDFEGVRLGSILNQIGGARKLKLVILDACRNNIFPMAGATRSQSRGLARVEPENNTLVAYAAAAGTTAEDGTGSGHSPFTTALLKYIEEPGLEVSYVFRNVRDDVYEATGSAQVPHLYGTLGRERIYFNPADSLQANSPERRRIESPDRSDEITALKRELEQRADELRRREEELQRKSATLTVPRNDTTRSKISRKAATNGDWAIWIPPPGNKVTCFASTVATRRSPQAGELAYAYVSNFTDGTTNEISIHIGAHADDLKNVLLEIGNETFPLFTKEPRAYTRRDDARIVAAMRSGRQMVLSGTTTGGTRYEDAFSLSGFSAIVDKMPAVCP